MSDTYEFNDLENQSFLRLVAYARVLGVMVLLAGSTFLMLSMAHIALARQNLSRIFPILVAAIGGVSCSVAIAAYLIDASSQLKKVVDTEGNDINHVLDGLLRFSTIFKAGQIILWVLCVVLVGILAGSFVWGV